LERILEFQKKKFPCIESPPSQSWKTEITNEHVNIIKHYNAFYDLSHTSRLPSEYAAATFFFNKIVHSKVFLKHIENSNAALCFHGSVQAWTTIIIKAMHFYMNKQFLLKQKKNFRRILPFILFFVFSLKALKLHKIWNTLFQI